MPTEAVQAAKAFPNPRLEVFFSGIGGAPACFSDQ
jgi:hypothetical protein